MNLFDHIKQRSILCQVDLNGANTQCTGEVRVGNGSQAKVSDRWSAQDLPEIVERLGKRGVWELHVTGAQVLKKELLEDDDLGAALFGADPEDFYIQRDPKTRTAFIARKEDIDKLLHVFQEKKLFVKDLYLGTSNEFEDRLPSSVDAPWVRSSKEELKFKRFYNIGGLAVVALLVVAISVTQNMRTSLEKQQSMLATEIQAIERLEANNASLSAQIEKRKVLVSNLGLGTKYRYSGILQSIANSAPDGIALERLEHSPLLEKIKAEQALSIDHGRVEIHGESPDQTLLNEWISMLATFNDIDQVHLSAYDHQTPHRSASFLLELSVR